MIKLLTRKTINQLKSLSTSLFKNKNQTIKNLQNLLHTKEKEIHKKEKELENLKPEYYWFKWYYSEYAATLRMLQYKKPTLDINKKLIIYNDEFINIEKVIRKIIVPPTSNGAFTKEYIYFAARNAFLPNENDNEINLYSISYLGNAEFAHSKQVFDAFIDHQLLSNSQELAQLGESAGLLTEFIQNDKIGNLEYAHAGEYKHFRPFSYNTGDFDQDGKHDFMLGEKLLLSSNNYQPIEGLDLPQESIFLKTHDETLLLSLHNNYLIINKYDATNLIELSKTPINSEIYKNIPHVLFPLPLHENFPPIFAIRSQRGLDLYLLNETMIPELKWWITGLVEKEVLIGAFGKFTGNEYIDFWISQIATGTERIACQDQILLISSQKLLNAAPGEVPLQNVLHFTVKGSDRYSDYDGISTSLSPIAGDISGNGKPDLTFVGHRHMNEAGALYILLNEDIEKGRTINITDKKIIKILGKPMCQLAPPYIHWDATDLTGNGHCDIIVSADNDLYSGLHAGAVYILDSKKIVDLWHTKGNANNQE